ncbi:MAG: glycogen/starch/alpha-glucan phosphorylase, partial [Planctomycetes bacterium]|nr:glycogen/starch/alpha-glucan phosphorylase [Planctomycetota bacterium]
DLASYMEAQAKLSETYRDQDKWARMAILNVANSGKFSSDRTIREYAEEVWHVQPCKIDGDDFDQDPIDEFTNEVN